MATQIPLRVGILGAGQLGYMLCRAARRLGVETVVVTPDPSAPAIAAADNAIIGALDEPGVAAAAIARCDTITFEFEAVPDAMLERLRLAQECGEILVRPGVDTLATLRNKALQKHWTLLNRLPALPYRTLAERDPKANLIATHFGFPFVQKTQVGGYDGRGVQIIRDAADLERLWPIASYVEPFLECKREIAVLVARGSDGDIRHYPPVHMTFAPDANVLETASSPAELPEHLSRNAVALARRAVELLRGVGVFAVEMFVTPRDELLVNEISPRVHNSGHHTLEASETSQFEQHVRAVANLALGQVGEVKPSVMQNLLYDDALAGLCASEPGQLPVAVPDTYVHWYGKKQGRSGRKMGHITCLVPSRRIARQRAAAALAQLAAAREVCAA